MFIYLHKISKMLTEKISTEDILKMAELLRVIAHPMRLDILQLLREEKELTVGEIQSKLDCNCEQSMLSHHLTKMKDKGVLKSHKKGKFIYYSLVNEKICSIFECFNKYNSL